MISENFINRSFVEVTGGEYDEDGFYITPNGSFWDTDGVYFNREGFDSHKGFYNNEKEYIPGPGWVEDLLCYEEEKEELSSLEISNNKNSKSKDEAECYNSDKSADEDEPFEEVDYDKILAEEETKYANLKIISNLPSIKASAGKDKSIDNLNESKVITSNVVTTDLLFGPSPIKNTFNFSNDKQAAIDLDRLDTFPDLSKQTRKEKQIAVDSLFI